MSFRQILVILCCSLLLASFNGQDPPIYKDPSQPVEARVKDLLARMTPEEKFWQCFMIPGDLDHVSGDQYRHGIFGLQISATAQNSDAAGQMLQYHSGEDGEKLARKINAIQRFFVEETRLGIPIIPFDEALHGLVREGATAYPQSIALAASFNPMLMRQVARAIAEDARLRGMRQVLGPVINLASDVRWGRTEETYGEDPFLTSVMGTEYAAAFERIGIITTPKHFLANVGDGGRDSYPIHWSRRYLEETHLVPFRRVFELGHSRSVMTAYNLVDGRPATANQWLLTDKLKQDWKFGGFVISDAGAVGGANVLHFTARDYEDAGAQAMSAGLDVIFQTDYEHYKLFIAPFLDGRISPSRIDDAVARVLRAKFELGLFDDPYISEQDIEKLQRPDNPALAERAAAESCVLLQNSQEALPIADHHKRILVVGPDATEARLGGYSGPGIHPVSILQGIHEYAAGKGVQISYAKGFNREVKACIPVPKEFLQELRGSYYNNADLQGQPVFERNDEQINFRWTLYSPDPTHLRADQYSVRWKGTLRAPVTGDLKIGLRGNDGFRLYIDGKLVVDRWEKVGFTTGTGPDSTLVLANPLGHWPVKASRLEQGKQYGIVVEYREMRGEADVRLVWDYSLPDYEKDFQKALRQARRADYIVVVAGIREGEFQDRSSLSLPGNQERFIHEAGKLNKPVCVVLVGGSAVKTTSWKDEVDAILDVWYPGEAGGNAVAKVLFGEVNPSGKLPITWPREEGQLPLAYNHHPTGRGNDYNDGSGEPLYPFGFGLSYTQFRMSDLRLNQTSFQSTDTLVATVDVANTGLRSGSEVVQLYLKDLLGTFSSPVLALKAFEKVSLAPGEVKQVRLVLPIPELRSLDRDMKWGVEPGTFRLCVGSSSRNLPLKQDFVVR